MYLANSKRSLEIHETDAVQVIEVHETKCTDQYKKIIDLCKRDREASLQF